MHHLSIFSFISPSTRCTALYSEAGPQIFSFHCPSQLTSANASRYPAVLTAGWKLSIPDIGTNFPFILPRQKLWCSHSFLSIKHGVSQPRNEDNHLSSFCTDIGNVWICNWNPRRYFRKWFLIKHRVKLKWSRYRPGVAQRVGRGIALLLHDRGTRRGRVVSSTPRPHFSPGKEAVPILEEAGLARGPVWTGGKSRPPPGFDPGSFSP